jgi:hypothetical protein
MGKEDMPRRAQWLARFLLLINAAFVAFAAAVAYSPHTDAIFWLLAVLSALLFVVALFGPARLRSYFIGIWC